MLRPVRRDYVAEVHSSAAGYLTFFVDRTGERRRSQLDVLLYSLVARTIEYVSHVA